MNLAAADTELLALRLVVAAAAVVVVVVDYPQQYKQSNMGNQDNREIDDAFVTS